MAIKYHQISLNEVFSDCQTKLIEEAPSFFQLLSEHFDLDTFIPPEFVSAFYLSVGRTLLYPLHGFLSAFILQKIFLSQQIPCSFFLSGSARNFGTSVASQKFLMLLS